MNTDSILYHFFFQFTDVAATFTGLIKAIETFSDDLKANHVSVFVGLVDSILFFIHQHD